MRQICISVVSLMILIVAFSCISEQQSPTVKIIALPDLAPDAAFSSGVVAGNTFYCSGKIGTNPETGELGTGIKEQTKFALERIEITLESEGFSLSNIVKVTVYLTNLDDYADMNDMYSSYFPGGSSNRPARATVQVAGLVRGALIEISCIAVK